MLLILLLHNPSFFLVFFALWYETVFHLWVLDGSLWLFVHHEDLVFALTHEGVMLLLTLFFLGLDQFCHLVEAVADVGFWLLEGWCLGLWLDGIEALFAFEVWLDGDRLLRIWLHRIIRLYAFEVVYHALVLVLWDAVGHYLNSSLINLNVRFLRFLLGESFYWLPMGSFLLISMLVRLACCNFLFNPFLILIMGNFLLNYLFLRNSLWVGFMR